MRYKFQGLNFTKMDGFVMNPDFKLREFKSIPRTLNPIHSTLCKRIESQQLGDAKLFVALDVPCICCWTAAGVRELRNICDCKRMFVTTTEDA